MPNDLKRIREAKGLTQKELGKLINKTDVTVSRYESEDQRLTLPLMRQLSIILGCTVGQIAGEATAANVSSVDCERLDGLIQRVLEINAKISLRNNNKSLSPSQVSQLVTLYYKSDIEISDSEMERSAELLINAK